MKKQDVIDIINEKQDIFSEYWTEFVQPTLLILVVLILGIVFCYVTYDHYNNQKLSGHFDIKETIKGNR